MAAYNEAIRSGRWRADEYPPPPHIHPRGIEDAGKLPNITRRLLERGYSESDVRKVLGENWIRVLRVAWERIG
jgi:membrane dipeptidase